jgi:hypothetical protein
MGAMSEYQQKRTDLSDYLIHLTKGEGSSDNEKNANAKDNLMTILSPNEHGVCVLKGHEEGLFKIAAKGNDLLSNLICSVSLTETPLEHLGHFSNQYSKYGLVFEKDFVRRQGGNPIFYISTLYGDRLKKAALDLITVGDYDKRDLAYLLPFFSIFGKDATGKAIDFYWEREWRVPQNLGFRHENVFAGLCENKTDVTELSARYPEIPFICIDWNYDQKLSYLRNWRSPNDRRVVVENMCPYGAAGICPVFD